MAAKVPLAVRKDLRDSWEAKKAEHEAKLSELLHVPWTFNFDAAAIYAFATGDYSKERPGQMLNEYAKELTGNIEWNYKQLGDMGIEELNKVASSHSVVLAEDPSVEVSGCDIVDGSLRILFGKGQLGNGISQATTVDKIIDAVSKAEATSGAAADLDYHARSSIKDDYEPKIGAVSDRIKKILALPDLVLEPNFEATFAALSAASDRSRLDGIWQKQLGSFLIEYFESLANNLEYEGFGKDELMQEAFAEGVESKKVEFQIVNKLQKGEYNEVAVEDGVLYIRTVPGSWGTNIHNTGKGLVDLL